MIINTLFSFLVPRNYDPTLNPFEVPREYTRAMNATKLERVLAKPFLASLDGHRDAVNCMAKHSTSLSTLLSGACDGEVNTHTITICFIIAYCIDFYEKEFTPFYYVCEDPSLHLLDIFGGKLSTFNPKVKVWNLTKHNCVRTIQAHEGFVRGMVVRFCGTSFYSVNVYY